MPSSNPGAEGASPLDAMADEAQRAFQARRSLSIRTRLTLGLLLWLALSLGVTVVSILILGRVQTKLDSVGAVERYAFEIQQARRFEKNYFLYGTNLPDALDGVHTAGGLLERERGSIASVLGQAALDTMRLHVQRYEELLARLPALRAEADARRLATIEAELRVHGAEMVLMSEELSTRERRSVESLLVTSQRMAVAFLVLLLFVIGLFGVFVVRQILAPLDRIMRATRRIAEGDLTPITPRRRYHDEFSELAGAINYMMSELVRRQQLLVQTHKLQAIGTLTAGVAHELNNPINNIMLTADSLQEDYQELTDGDRLDMVADLVHESERARGIVRNLLDFARQTETELTPLDVEQIVGETLQLASNQVKIAKVKVQGEVEENVPPVFGDRQQLIQVFLNLVLNALHAMPGGGILTIGVEKSEDRNFVDISFADTGTGIASQHLSRIFDPFFSTKKQARGTGLGLSVSLGIIKQHGGDIRVKSAEGEGAVFTVSLPVARVPASMESAEAALAAET